MKRDMDQTWGIITLLSSQPRLWKDENKLTPPTLICHKWRERSLLSFTQLSTQKEHRDLKWVFFTCILKRTQHASSYKAPRVFKTWISDLQAEPDPVLVQHQDGCQRPNVSCAPSWMSFTLKSFHQPSHPARMLKGSKLNLCPSDLLWLKLRDYLLPCCQCAANMRRWWTSLPHNYKYDGHSLLLRAAKVWESRANLTRQTRVTGEPHIA